MLPSTLWVTVTVFYSSMKMGTPRQTRTPISNEQKEILRQFKDRGLHGTGAYYKDLLQQAVAATGLPENVVKGAVGNMKRDGNPTHKVTDCSVPTGSNGYQLFCSETRINEPDAAKRLKEWSRLWNALLPEQREHYNQRAAENKKRKLSDLTEEERDVQLKKYTKSIKSTFSKLHELKADGLCVVYKSESTFAASSGEGTKVLEKTFDTIESQFFVAKAQKVKAETERDRLRRQYSEKLNGIFVAYSGRESPFPYEKYNAQKTNFIIEGLPSDITILKYACKASMHLLRTVIAADLVLIRKEGATSAEDTTSAVDTTSAEGAVTSAIGAPSAVGTTSAVRLTSAIGAPSSVGTTSAIGAPSPVGATSAVNKTSAVGITSVSGDSAAVLATSAVSTTSPVGATSADVAASVEDVTLAEADGLDDSSTTEMEMEQSFGVPLAGTPCQVNGDGIIQFTDEAGNVLGDIVQQSTNSREIVCEYAVGPILPAAEVLRKLKEDLAPKQTQKTKKKEKKKTTKISSFFKKL